jgi:membrane-bound serine protease (ClpP class)
MRNALAAIGLIAGAVLSSASGAAAGATNFGAATAATESSSEPPPIVALELDGVVDPFTAGYVRDGIASARERSSPVLLRIDTPGGFDSSMRAIVQAIDASPVPVVCYVAPSGSRAASAGTFILIACPVAAMAPGTNVGAAHPVGVSGAILSEKVENDAVAFIRSQAELRGRNADWAEQAVRESVSVSAERALELGVIDLVAPDTAALLARIDGTTVAVAGGVAVPLRTEGVPVVPFEMGAASFLLHALITPDFAFLFFVLGLILLVIEVLHPGVSIPGIVGALLLVFALASFGMLPIELAGIVLLGISVVFFLLELKHPGVGLPAVGGVIFLVLGAVFLFDRAVPDVRVSPWLIATAAAVALLFFGVVVRASLASRRAPPPPGPDALVGSEGRAVTVIDPVGVVQVASEEWTAVSRGGRVERDTPVRVVGVDGLRVLVEPARSVTTSPAAPGMDEGREDP